MKLLNKLKKMLVNIVNLPEENLQELKDTYEEVLASTVLCLLTQLKNLYGEKVAHDICVQLYLKG